MKPNSFDYILATKLAAQTSDAYSYDRYGVSEWQKCIWFLLEEGYTNEAIEQILRSKTMRWAADGSPKGYEGTCKIFSRYYAEETASIIEMLVDDCGIENYLRTENTNA